MKNKERIIAGLILLQCELSDMETYVQDQYEWDEPVPVGPEDLGFREAYKLVSKILKLVKEG